MHAPSPDRARAPFTTIDLRDPTWFRSTLAAEATAEFVTGSYRFEVLPGVGHFITDQAPERTTELLLQHVGAHSPVKRP